MIVTCPVCPGRIDPLDGDVPSQLEANILTFEYQLSVPPPLLVMVITWPVGLGCPCVLLKLKLSGEAPIMGEAGEGGA